MGDCRFLQVRNRVVLVLVSYGAIASTSLKHARLHLHLTVHVNEDVSCLRVSLRVTRAIARSAASFTRWSKNITPRSWPIRRHRPLGYSGMVP